MRGYCRSGERCRHVRTRHPLPERPDHRRRAGRMAGRARAVPAGGGAGLPVGEPGDHRAAAAGPGVRNLDGAGRSAARRAELDLRPGSGGTGSSARHRAAGGCLREGRPRLRPGGHGAGHHRHPHRRGGDERLPADHAGPRDPVDRVPAARCARPVPGRAPGGDRRDRGACLQGRQQRRLPGRLRVLSARVRGGLRAAVQAAGLAERAAGGPALSGGRHDHRGGHPAVHHAGPVRSRLPRPLQVQPVQAERDAGAVGLRTGPVPDTWIRGHHRLRPDQGALLPGAPDDQPDGDRPGGAGPVQLADPARARGPGRQAVRRWDAASAATAR